MANRIRLGVGCLNQTPLDWIGNQQRIEAAVAAAKAQRIDILCLPELCLTGYGCEDAFLSKAVLEEASRRLQNIAPMSEGILVVVGLPMLFAGGLYNVAAVVADGRCLGFVPKHHLANDGVHYEARWFRPWPIGLKKEISRHGVSLPFGDACFDWRGVRVGIEICEDAWVSERAAEKCRDMGADIVLNLSASHFAFGKFKRRQDIVKMSASTYGVVYLYANALGNEAGRVIYDGGGLIADRGDLVAIGKRFSYQDSILTTADFEIESRSGSRLRCVQSNVDQDLWECGPDAKEEEFSRAVALGLFDYLRKSHLQGFVVSLSGGADSSACASLVGIMAQLAAAELGIRGMQERIGVLLPESKSAKDLMKKLLLCIYLATEQSGESTRLAAEAVATGIGATWMFSDIEDLVDGYRSRAQVAIGRDLAWQTDDISLQNIQARTRGPMVWLMANLRKALLMTTSNRSEAAVGYATMDGDTCGGVAPLGGIDKAFLRAWLIWLESRGPQDIGPMPFLHSVNILAPTAELRPPQFAQTDERDLMPYSLLDKIERFAIRDRMSPMETFSTLTEQESGYTREYLRDSVARFFRLWSQNQWKRERYAPSFHLDDENLDPKTWCRFPILSGGYAWEIAQLQLQATSPERSE